MPVRLPPATQTRKIISISRILTFIFLNTYDFDYYCVLTVFILMSNLVNEFLLYLGLCEGFNFPQKFKQAIEGIFDKEWKRIEVKATWQLLNRTLKPFYIGGIT